MNWIYSKRTVPGPDRAVQTSHGYVTEAGPPVEVDELNPVKIFFLTLIALVLIVALAVGGCAGCKGFNRAQRRADANNRVQITSINIRNARQQAKVTAAQDAQIQALADQRVIAARGIRAAQDEISKTLTPLYLQWESVQAQMKLAGSPTHTQIYVPTGAMGVPLVQTAPKP